MKFLAPLLLMISAPAASLAKPDASTLCPSVGNLAASALEAYYVGVPLGEMLEITGDFKMGINIVLDAYDEPRYSTAEVIADATFDFRNKWEHQCFQSLNNQ